ncbi:LPS-assembly protein LptD [Psychrobacter cryohalolentis]|uniref:LPS-assembly protein LptD n=1 Tax=Psychrobacter cryohalolentis (strain ATCC BAA-1226 / DSM 17306 / VKM B-2378 / K5) TaxID=335284 RepID=LPTD_PSYCK|nr:RecName: Full=LPS-assembly protein LptD; Flags: Precursor [Psychrobacter cryohalolentis K5]ABE75475.1 putative organic solvent tolerance protein [Psychrobacter cryohalolentis K5]ASE25665.1 LPS-assembly protein LptD [Psychrobacter cryohalolentis]
MLYSPLYQSIRLILFGALGLSSLTVSAAINQTDSMMPEPLVTDSSNQYADDVATDAGFNNEINNQDISYQSDSQQSAAYKKASLSSDATLSNDAAVNNNNITAINDRTKTSQDSRVAPVNTSNAAKAGNRRIDTNDESIQESLKRLAEFYELTPDTNVATSNNTGTSVNDEQNNIQNSLTPVTTNIPTVGSNLRLLPHTVDSAARCEGQWVYPKKNPNYQRAVNEASASSGQPAPNLNGLPNNQAPLFAESDYGYYDNVDYAELSGNVIIDQGTQHIEAEKIVLDLSNGVAAAQGKVMFTDQATGNVSVNGAQDRTQQNGKTSLTDKATQGGLIGVADNLNYNTETGQSTATNVAFASVELQAHGYAKRLNRPNESQYELDEVMYSTCPPTNRKWQFDAKSIDLDTETGRGEAYNTTFRIADVPVFYLPYFNFPIDSRRGSGFLLPNASISSENGLEIDVPYYFNLAPNYDATLSTHIYTTRNPMLSGEFRYLTENYGEGIFNGSYLPNDKEYDGEDRRSLFYDHYWSSTSIPRLSGEAKYSYVSDADYLNDFDTLGLSDNTLNLPRRAQLNYYNDYVDGELKVETFQTLDALNNNGQMLQDKDKPYSRLPQLKLDYRLPWAKHFDITGVSDSAYFKKSIDDGSENEKSGTRFYNKLSASYPMENSWGYIKPKLSLQHLFTTYDEDSLVDNSLDKDDGSQSVFVPQASIDAGLHFYQAGSPFGAFDDTLGGYRLLSPRLKYTYSPYRDQNDIPNFNTRIASINYEQLFSDSWFLGHDRLQDLHAFTPGINYRYIDATGVTRFDGSIGEQFYLDDGRVTLDNTKPVFTSSSSGLVWDTSTQPYNNVWVDVSGALTNSYDLNYITTELRYQPSDRSLFNVGFIKRQRDENTNQLPLSALTASAVFPINNNWRVLAQGQYDYNRNQMLDSLIGIDYEDCCFGFAVYGRRYYNDLNIAEKPTQAIMAEVRLSGLGSGSSRLTRLLADKVLGFEPVQNAWKD